MVYPIESKLPVLVVCDQSKSGYAVKVGDISGRTLRLFEMSGTGMSTEEFCDEFSDYLKRLLAMVKIDGFFVEKMILKKGMGYYHSSETLHDVRVMTKLLCESLTGKPPEEINNQEWKSNILPKGYRSRSEKGSLRYLRDVNPAEYALSSDNITDVVCMFDYVMLLRHRGQILQCHGSEPSTYNSEIYIVSADDQLMQLQCNVFKYNPDFSVTENASYFVNRIPVLGIAEIPISQMSLEDIYKYARGFARVPTRAFLAVRRCT
jgi:hypothetical protein